MKLHHVVVQARSVLFFIGGHFCRNVTGYEQAKKEYEMRIANIAPTAVATPSS